ncbi:MAG: hypothetical protein Q7T41_02890 [Candidatus Saccharibacteria bacterium]|nr:hypothetical protein [Candidatus Saccharibacteria bacterium]
MEDNNANNDESAAKVTELESRPETVTEQVSEPVVVTPQEQAPIATAVTEEPKPAEAVAPKPKSPRPKWFLPAILAGLLVLGGGAAAYVTVFQKSADSAWKSALKNTADGLDAYLKTTNEADQKGFKLDGNFKISSPLAVDGSMEGQWYESDGSMKADVGAAGARINAEVRTIAPDSGSTPDIYMKVDGLEGLDTLFGSFGASEVEGIGESLSALNDQWFFIDHTIIDQATAADQSTGLELSKEDLKTISDKVSVVLRDRMFSTSQDKAIFTIEEKLGKEDFEGLSTQKIKVKVDKENFKEFVTTLKDAIKDTKAEELLKAGQTDKTLEEVLDFDNILKELDDTDFSDATADVWVEANGAFVRNVRIYPMQDKKDSNYLDFGMNYKGGDTFPIQMKATIDDDGDKGTFSLGVELNKSNGGAKMSFNVDMNVDGGDIKAEGELSVTGSNDKKDIEKPENAQNIFELLGGFQSALMDPYSSLDSSYDSSLYDPSLYEDIDPSVYDDLELQ